MGLAALSLVAVEFETFRARLPTFHEFFGPHNWIYLGATMDDDETPGYATTNIKHYEDRALFTKPPRQTVYDDEGLEPRLERRRRNWTPIAG